ncbi:MULTISPECIES: restriction endonuclease [Bacillaceae]|uniref:Restriction endonuclease n=1 Tax=Evansella alkalicola TaxID=745819 RepID=A0ABS6JZK1_9BACI|nr:MULTISPECIES: restriction endonuclease [Bacillaceae]MBU9723820.1 restriction endonuclease [Bacillus alkalicola]
MNKKDRSNVASVVAGLFLIGSLYLFLMVFNSSNYMVLLGILVVTFIIRILVQAILPKKKKKTVGRKKRTKPRSSGKASVAQDSPNRLREDKEIIKDTLENLSWREFERLCFLYFKARGYKPKETSEGADGGVDLIIYNPKDKAYEAVQIKHYIHSGNQITVKEIRELNSAKRNHKCALSKFITTTRYTNEALKQADVFNVDCHNIDWVRNNIVKWQEVQKKKIS